MKITELKKGMAVKDGWRVGTVQKVLKTVAYVWIDGEELKYDASHCQFLSPLKSTGNNKKKKYVK